MNNDQLYMAEKAARYAQAYLRKLKQWKDGKIELAVEGCDQPYCPDDEELKAEMAEMAQFIDDVNDLLNPMKVSETIPMTPQEWNKNPGGYVRHQTKLKELVEWFEANGIDVSLPEDTGSWDKGVDCIASGLRIDLKSFGVEPYGISFTWASTYYQGRPAPIYSETETDYFVHPMGDDPEKWIVAPASELRTSKFDLPPYYFQSVCMTVGKLARGLCTRRAA